MGFPKLLSPSENAAKGFIFTIIIHYHHYDHFYFFIIIFIIVINIFIIIIVAIISISNSIIFAIITTVQGFNLSIYLKRSSFTSDFGEV